MIHYAIIALLLVSIALLGYHIKQMKDMASAERFQKSGINVAEHFQKSGINAAERFSVQPMDQAAERFARRDNIGRKDVNSAEHFGVGTDLSAHLHTRLNRNTGRLYTGEAFGMRKRLN